MFVSQVNLYRYAENATLTGKITLSSPAGETTINFTQEEAAHLMGALKGVLQRQAKDICARLDEAIAAAPAPLLLETKIESVE